MKDVKVPGAAASSSSLKVVGDEDSYAVSPRAPLLTTDLQNNVYLCGEARFGQLGSGIRPVSHHRPVPTPQPQSVAGDNSWAFISLGTFHAAAITSQGKLYTWGLNSQGQCGVVEPDPADRGRVTYYPGPARVKSSTTGGTYKAVACGGEHTVALGSRGVCAWGNNKFGQLGLGVGTPTTVWRPLLLPSLARTSVTQLVCGAHHSMALTAQSQVLAWGSNEQGQLGLGDLLDRNTPTPIEGLWGLPVMRLAAGDAHSLALTTTGQLFTWGSNNHGQCGVVVKELPQEEETSPLASPQAQQQVQGEGGADQLGPPPDLSPQLLDGWRAAMAGMGIATNLAELSLHESGWRGVEVAVEWLFSQDDVELARLRERWLAARTPPNPAAATTPVLPATIVEGAEGGGGGVRSRLSRVAGYGDAVGGAAVGREELEAVPAVKEQEELVVLTPTEVLLPGVRHMAAGMCFSVAVLDQGDVYSWGLGAWGALGHGDLQDQRLPNWMEALAGVVVERVSCGQYHSTFVARDGSVWGCGRCEAGQLGHVIPQAAPADDSENVTPLPPPSNSVATTLAPSPPPTNGNHHNSHSHSGGPGQVPGSGSSSSGGGGSGAAQMGIISRPIRLQLTATLMDELSAVHAASHGNTSSPIQQRGGSGGDVCAEAPEQPHAVNGVVVRVGSAGAAAGGGATAASLAASPSKTIPYHDHANGGLSPQRLVAAAGVLGVVVGKGVVLHEVVAGGCNTAILLRKQQETPSPWQVTLLAKLQAAVARTMALQASGGGPSAQLALALRNVARGASLVLSSPAALCAALAIRGGAPHHGAGSALPHVRLVVLGADGSGSLQRALASANGGAVAAALARAGSGVLTPRAAAGGGTFSSPGRLPGGGAESEHGGVLSVANTPRAGGRAGGPVPVPLPLDIPLLDQLYCSLLELAGVSNEPAPLGSLTSEYDQGPAMCELQRYGLQQALLRCGLTLCEDLMVHAPLLRTPERAQVLLAALHCPLLSDPSCCKQLLPKLCHAVLAAPAAARRMLVRWWASYPPDLLLERLVQPMQAFITKELAAVKKLTSSIMAVIKVLARVEAANQLAGGPLPPEAFYNTLISEKMDVQDHYSAWRTTQDLGGGLPGIRPVTNTSGVQLYACEPDSDLDLNNSGTPLISPSQHAAAAAPHGRSRSAFAGQPAAAAARGGSVLGGGAARAAAPGHAMPSRGSSGVMRTSDTGSEGPGGDGGDSGSSGGGGGGGGGPGSGGSAPPPSWDLSDASLAEMAAGIGGMRMSDPGRRVGGGGSGSGVHLPALAPNGPSVGGSSSGMGAGGSTGGPTALPQLALVVPARRTLTGTSSELQHEHSRQLPLWQDDVSAAAASVTLPQLPQPPGAAAARGVGRSGLPPRAHAAAAAAVASPGPSDGSTRPAGRSSEPGSPRGATGAHGRHSLPHQPSPEHRAEPEPEPAPTAAVPAPTLAPPAPRPAAEPGPFSFCTYPFLLDARAKSNLLHIEARFQMEQTVAHARMEQQLYGQHSRFNSRSDSGAGRPPHAGAGAHPSSAQQQQQPPVRGGGDGGGGGSAGAAPPPGLHEVNGPLSSSSSPSGLGPEDQIMLHVLDKVNAYGGTGAEEELDLYLHSLQSTGALSPAGSSHHRAGVGLRPSSTISGAHSTGGVAARYGSGGEGGRAGGAAQSSSSGRSRGFRGLLQALLRTGSSSRAGSAGGMHGGSGGDTDEGLDMLERRAESFKLPRPVDCAMPGMHSDMCIIRVRRTHLVEDAMDEITRQVRRDLFKPLRVHFIGEEGIDAGGVKKEFFALLLAEMLKPEYGLMEVQPESNTYWFPRRSVCAAHRYQLLGLVLGLAVYNRVLLDFALPMAAYKKLLGVPVGLRELTEMCPSVGKSLKQLLEMDGPPGTIEELLALTWVVEDQAWGVRSTHELVPGGDQIPVTEENRDAYVDAMVGHYLTDSVKWQFEAFARGFGVLCNGPALRLFNAQELERLVCGNPTLDWAALQRNAKYEGGYTANSPVVVWLWDIVRNELPLEEKKRFLKFFTGSDRAPIGGLGTLRCLIQRAGPDSSRLPTSHTCFNTLLLPEYLARARLARQLRTAINNAEGFGLE